MKIDTHNNEIKAFGIAKIARDEAILNPRKKDEFDAKLDAKYRQGVADGKREQRELDANRKAKRILTPGATPPGRPPKYHFSLLKVGATMTVNEPNRRRVYMAARQWAWRNAPSRKFSVRSSDQGTTITRTA